MSVNRVQLEKHFSSKSYAKCGTEAIPRPFSRKQKLRISLDQYSISFIYIFLIVCQVEDYRKLLKLSCRPLAFTSNKAFLKKKKRSETSFSVSFSAWFLRKIFMLLYSITWPNFNVWLLLLCEILGNMYIVIFC